MENTNTLKRRLPEEVKKAADSGVHVEAIPAGKSLRSRKAPCGRRKARIVGCGHYGTPDDTVTVTISTGGLDAVSLRTLVAIAAQQNWAIGVAAAFLQEPKRSVAHRITFAKLLTKLGIIEDGWMWEAQGALYGLRESPEDWSQFRNQRLREAS